MTEWTGKLNLGIRSQDHATRHLEVLGYGMARVEELLPEKGFESLPNTQNCHAVQWQSLTHLLHSTSRDICCRNARDTWVKKMLSFHHPYRIKNVNLHHWYFMCLVSDEAGLIPPNLIVPLFSSECCSHFAGEMESPKGNDFSRITQQPELGFKHRELDYVPCTFCYTMKPFWTGAFLGHPRPLPQVLTWGEQVCVWGFIDWELQ